MAEIQIQWLGHSCFRVECQGYAIVLDPFGGSGSTLIACEQTDRICRTIELDEKFCDVIVNRYIEQVGTADGVSVLRDGRTYSYEEVTDGTE